ncbi:MAG: hypothetical protein ACJA2K_000980 [Thalassolituus sp.]|jgi:hypothetical protein
MGDVKLEEKPEAKSNSRKIVTTIIDTRITTKKSSGRIL